MCVSHVCVYSIIWENIIYFDIYIQSTNTNINLSKYGMIEAKIEMRIRMLKYGIVELVGLLVR